MNLLLIELEPFAESYSIRVNSIFTRYDYHGYVDELHDLESTVEENGNYSNSVVSLLDNHVRLILETIGVTLDQTDHLIALTILETITTINEDLTTAYTIDDELSPEDNMALLVHANSAMSYHDILISLEEVNPLTVERMASNLDVIEIDVDIVAKIALVKRLGIKPSILIEEINPDIELQTYLALHTTDIIAGTSADLIVDNFLLLLALSSDVYTTEMSTKLELLEDLAPEFYHDDVIRLVNVRKIELRKMYDEKVD